MTYAMKYRWPYKSKLYSYNNCPLCYVKLRHPLVTEYLKILLNMSGANLEGGGKAMNPTKIFNDIMK